MPTRKQRVAFRITSNPSIFDGKPIIRGMRISVETVLKLLEQGVTWNELLADYPDLTRDDILACVAFSKHDCRV